MSYEWPTSLFPCSPSPCPPLFTSTRVLDFQSTVDERATFLQSARRKVEDAKVAGKETLVRAEVADLVLQLLDSEAAALEAFRTRCGF